MNKSYNRPIFAALAKRAARTAELARRTAGTSATLAAAAMATVEADNALASAKEALTIARQTTLAAQEAEQAASAFVAYLATQDKEYIREIRHQHGVTTLYADKDSRVVITRWADGIVEVHEFPQDGLELYVYTYIERPEVRVKAWPVAYGPKENNSIGWKMITRLEDRWKEGKQIQIQTNHENL